MHTLTVYIHNQMSVTLRKFLKAEYFRSWVDENK